MPKEIFKHQCFTVKETVIELEDSTDKCYMIVIETEDADIEMEFTFGKLTSVKQCKKLS